MDIINKLIQIGLTEKQAIIYSSLLENGLSPARLLIIRTGLKRGITYEILEQLIKLNLVEKVEDRGKIALFRTTHPQELENFFQKKKKEAEDTEKFLKNEMGNFTSMYNLLSGKPNIRFFEGEEGIREVIMDSLNAKETILQYIDNEMVHEYLPKENDEYVKQRIKKGIKKKMLSPDSAYIRDHVKVMNKDLTELRILQQAFPFNTVMQIYDNKITYLTLSENKKIGAIIEDFDIANMHKVLFEINFANSEQLL